MGFEFKGLDHVQLAAPRGCEEEASAFFGDLLGWKEIPKPEPLRKRGGAWFQCGEHQVHIGVQKDFVRATKAHPCFNVQGLEELKTFLREHGFTVIDDEAREDEGVKRFYMNDPFGNRLEFMEA